jgi:aspartate/methionine/tyrosine aminotransferase
MSESRLDQIFRPVPRTGVIYVMTEAGRRGFTYGAPGWANLGQGAPETGSIPGGAERLDTISVDAQSAEYAPVAGLWELREAVASLYNHRYRRGMPSQYSAENVAIAAGGRLALTRLATALGPIHLGHLLPDYTAYEELLSAFQRFVPIPIVVRADQEFRLTPERFADIALGTGLGALLLSNPSNPTGQLIDGEAMGEMVGSARRLGCSLIVDEFYAHYTYDRDAPVSAAAHVEDVDADPVVVLDGLTKNWRYPGLRLSWTVAPKPVIDRVASAGSFLDGGPMHAAQIAACPLLEPSVADREAAAIRTHFTAKRDRMVERLQAMGIRVPAVPRGAFYCFADLSQLPASLRSGMDFFRAALDQQVVTVPGEFFDVDPGQRRQHLPSRLASYVRLSFGPASEELERGLDALEATIAAAR